MAKVKTTLMIDAEVLKTAKKRAVDLGVTLSAYFEQLAAPAEPRRRKREFKLPTHGSGGLRPGVDLTNNESIRELLDEEDNRWSSLM